MKKLILLSFLITACFVKAQIGIGTGTTPDGSAALDLLGTKGGLLPPRLTTAQRGSIAQPATGLIIYNISTNQQEINEGTPSTPSWTSTTIPLIGTAPILITNGVISLADAGVTTVKIADAAVTTGKIIDGAVNSAKILDGSIATVDIANNAVTTAKITDANITSVKIADGAVSSAKIADNTITNLDFAAGTGGIYKGSGNLPGNVAVTQGANTIAFTSTAKNGFSVDGTTFSVDAANSSVGIGTANPDASAKLDVTSTNKGVLLPRVALASNTDATTIPSPSKGMLIYNTATIDNLVPGLTINLGDATTPLWSTFQAYNNTSGVRTDKLKYTGNGDPTKTVIIDNFLVLRVAQSGLTYSLQIRLLTAPTGNVTYRYARLGYLTGVRTGFNSSITFTPVNFATYQDLDTPNTGGSGTTLAIMGHFSSPSRDRLHEIEFLISADLSVKLIVNTF